jgi:hypothetical protein
MADRPFRLLATFRAQFERNIYKHRNPRIGNLIGRELYEDLFLHELSRAYVEHVNSGLVAADSSGSVSGRKLLRRNDTMFGRIPAAAVVKRRPGFAVPEGPIADPRIGCEVKIIAKDPLSQIDRVISDLGSFAQRVKRVSPQAVSVAIVGVNFEKDYLSYEGDKTYSDRLKGHEPAEAIRRIERELSDAYDELVILPFEASNRSPYQFRWSSPKRSRDEYAAALTRIGERYQERFR